MSEEAPEAASTVSLKLPPFWSADPELWFLQVEAQFATRNITADTTKFNHLVASLSPEAAGEIRDLLITPPPSDKYKAVKEAVIKRTTSSAQERIRKVLTEEELDGRKPSQLLRRMQQLIGNNSALVPDGLLKQVWIARLPVTAQAILATSDSLSLDKMAEIADKVMEVAVTSTVNAVQSSSTDVTELRKEIQEMKQLLRGRDQNRPAGGTQRARSRTPAPRDATGGSLCWFHSKFGDNAKKCRDPCSKAGNGTGSR